MAEQKDGVTSPGPNWVLSDDCRTVTITFPTNPPVSVALDAAGVEDVLETLGDFRILMKPEVAGDFAFRQSFSAVPDPGWASEPDRTGDSVLHLRDPRYGWLHYLLPSSEAGNLATTLLKQVQEKATRGTNDNKN